VWSYGAALARLAVRWWTSPDYIYGFLVIPFAVLLLWRRRDQATRWSARGTWWGVPLLVVCGLMRCASAYMSDPVFDPLSLVPCLAGLALIFGGWGGLGWTWPSIVFLVFMIPLPSFVESWISMQLQSVSTMASTLVMQTIGLPAVAEGNVIIVGEKAMGVVEACGGLRSVMLFSAVCVGAALVVKGLPEKILIVVSAVPVTIAANVVRITVTGVLYHYVSAEFADALFHGAAGLFMLPLAVLMLWGELALLGKLLVAPVSSDPVAVPLHVGESGQG
jgi:exosortase